MPDVTPMGRRPRADAQQSRAALVAGARSVFAASGVDAPARDIAAAAGVGVGTLYRHFPNRADLVAAVFTTEIDATASAASEFLATEPPGVALDHWVARFTRFVATKRGLGAALHSGDPAFEPLPTYFIAKLGPAITSLVRAAGQAGEIRSDVDPIELLQAIGDLSHRAPGADDAPNPMVLLLLDGLRRTPPKTAPHGQRQTSTE